LKEIWRLEDTSVQKLIIETKVDGCAVSLGSVGFGVESKDPRRGAGRDEYLGHYRSLAVAASLVPQSHRLAPQISIILLESSNSNKHKA
jgi:hypothetical protein